MPYTEIHLYPDNDKYGSMDNMNRIANFIRPLQIPLYIHRNLYEGEKDFGVSKDKIIEQVSKLI